MGMVDSKNTIIVRTILKFLNCHVYTWETLFQFFRQKHLQNFDTAHLLAHEGSNHALKSHSASIMPTMDMDTSANTINLQTDIKVAELEEIIYRDVYFQHKRWSQLPKATYTVTNAERLINHMVAQIHLYKAKEVNSGIFQVFYIGDVRPTNLSSVELSNVNCIQECPIQLFSRIRTVTVESSSTMICMCCLFEILGIPCIHMACVADLRHQLIGCSFAGFTHHDTHVHWRSDFMHYAYKQTTHPDMYITIHQMAITSSGPNLGMTLPDSASVPIHQREIIHPAIHHLKNYEKEDILDSMSKLQKQRIRYTPSDEVDDSDKLDKWLDSLADELRLYTYGHIQDQFSQLILDSAIEGMKDGRIPRTRDSLKQMIEGAFSDCDQIGEIAVNEFIQHLTELHAFCNDKKKDLTLDSTNNKKRMIPMTQDKYISSAKCIFNSHHM
jgi:hypothetical protein